MLDPAVIRRVHASAGGSRWDLSYEQLASVLAPSVTRAFGGLAPSARELDRYLATLHLPDLGLACACALGHEGAWEHFVREHRPILYRAADALDPSGGAREIADALYADLFGVADEEGNRRSLFRYFHGRSSLGTWLRAVLAQRYVDQVRARRRTEPLPEPDELPQAADVPPPDPDRRRLRRALMAALAAAIAHLAPRDRLRLRSYYAAGLTLAQIGRLTGEHEATVSRHLKRTRTDVRERTERGLRHDARLSDAEIERCFELAVEIDPAGTLDLDELLGHWDGRKIDRAGRST